MCVYRYVCTYASVCMYVYVCVCDAWQRTLEHKMLAKANDITIRETSTDYRSPATSILVWPACASTAKCLVQPCQKCEQI